MPVKRTSACLAVLALLLAACGDGDRDRAGEPGASQAPVATPTPDPLPTARTPLPRGPRGYAEALTATTGRLHAAIGAWRAGEPSADARPPQDVLRLARHHRRLHQRLARRPALARAVLPRLRGTTKAEAVTLFTASRRLRVLTPTPAQRRRVKIRLGPALPPDTLRAHYRRAWRRFGVGWPLLAAVNFVESRFGRLRNESVAGARGPMQFMPPTWAMYGLGGDVRDPRDAILGAANYLHASGAPGDERRALFAYNHSDAYVSAVLRYARRIRADERFFYVLWAWGA